MIGRPLNDDQVTNGGAVEVYVRDGTTWWLEATLYAPLPVAEDFFGFTVDLDGDLALIGAPQRGVGGTAFVFRRTGTSWSFVDEFEPVASTPDARFGEHLAISGDTAVVSEPGGGSYVFVDQAGSWNQQAALPVTASRAVDVSGDTAAVAENDAMGVFVRDGAVWSEQASIPYAIGPRDIALSGDVLLVQDLPDLLLASIQVYVRGGTTWTRLAELAASANGLLAAHVEVHGNSVVFSTGGIGPYVLYEAELPAFVAPSVVHRNAGTNPDSYATTPAYIGQSLHFTVDLTTTGHEQALVFGFDSPFELTLGNGATLLCLDLQGSGGELINTGFHPGPLAEIELAVPNDLALSGFEVCTQALHGFGVVPFALSNAQDVVIGACF